MKKQIHKCRDCGFEDDPPDGFNLDKCPYCRNDDWKKIKKPRLQRLAEENEKLKAQVEQLQFEKDEFEKVAKEWMNDFDKLKEKYEPSIALLSKQLLVKNKELDEGEK